VGQTKSSPITRKQAALRVVDFYAGKVSIGELFDEIGRLNDPDVDELLYLVEHEPSTDGLLRVPAAAHAAHMEQIKALIAMLLAESD
jgi:hypothetical protein